MLRSGVVRLEEKIRRALVADDEDDVALVAVVDGRELAEIEAADPVVGDAQTRAGFPLALAQAFLADGGRGLRLSLELPEAAHMSAAAPLVVPQTIDVDHEPRGRGCADEAL